MGCCVLSCISPIRGRLMRQEELLTGQDICDLLLILSNVPAS